jgi:predicted alpha/beta hydrolase family esterase
MSVSIRERKGGLIKFIIIVIAILAIGSAVAMFRLNTLFGETLRVTITPEYSESRVNLGEQKNFEVDIKIYNKYVCDASCTYTLTDLSRNRVLDGGNFSAKAFKIDLYSKELPMDYRGYGRNLYLFRLECTNIHTTFCPSNNDIIIRKSLLVLSYEPSENQMSALSYLKSNYPAISNNIAVATQEYELSGKILSSVNFSFNKYSYDSLGKDLLEMNKDVDSLIDSWINDDYISARSLMEGSAMFDRSRIILSESLNYKKYLYQVIENHNLVIRSVSDNYGLLGLYNNILSLPIQVSGLNITESASLLNFILKSNSVISMINTDAYEYSIVYSNIVELGDAIPKINTVITERSRIQLVENYLPLFVYANIVCSIDDASESCNINISQKIEYLAENLINNSYPAVGSSTENVPALLRDSCTYASIINSDISDYISDNEDFNDSIEEGFEEELLLLEYRFLLEYARMFSDPLNISVSSTRFKLYEYLIAEKLYTDYGIANPEVELSGKVFDYSALSSLSIDEKRKIVADINSLSKHCSQGSDMVIPELLVLTSEIKNIPEFDIPDVEIRGMPSIIEKCCIYNICQPCTAGKISGTAISYRRPLVLLHGHSVNKEVDAYRSIEIFDGLEYALVDEEVYFLTGMIISGREGTKGILGDFAVPAVSKPTYYLETYTDLFGLNIMQSKEDDIDTYALRLKDSIEKTLYLTGSDKVDIVAHSMGGLVVRRYMQIFGTERVGKVILVGTPNNGINDLTFGLCKIFGATAECEDMRSSSLFMSKLNDPANQPDVSNMYLVIGRGCDTVGMDGDGVVTVASSLIKNFPEDQVLYIDRGDKGCSITNVFHQDLIRMNKYPEVYEFIKEKLEIN